MRRPPAVPGDESAEDGDAPRNSLVFFKRVVVDLGGDPIGSRNGCGKLTAVQAAPSLVLGSYFITWLYDVQQVAGSRCIPDTAL